MKRKYSYFDGKKQTEREYSYIPVRYILAVLITLFEVLAVIGIFINGTIKMYKKYKIKMYN